MKYTTLAASCSVLLVALLPQSAFAADYFVTRQGKDSNDGLKRESAFLTIQKGVDTLKPGDTLTIGPGEYHEPVRRKDLGGSDADTIIRAQIPGTVILRGDVPLAGFEKVPGSRFIYVTKLDPGIEIQVVNEVDTLTILEAKPTIEELEYNRSAFFQDRKAGKLYIASSDLRSATEHLYTVGLIPTHGIYLDNPTRVILEGLSVTGFNANHALPRWDQTLNSVWGIFLNGGKNCVIRDCRAYLNGCGIANTSNGADPKSLRGDNLIERCTVWGSNSAFGSGDMGGISLYSARRDTIRHSVSFLNRGYGINIYGGTTQYGGPTGQEEKIVMSHNLAWGNFCDYKIKTGFEYPHVVEYSVGTGLWSVGNTAHSLIGKGEKGNALDNILMSSVENLDPAVEFADPIQHDYHLQSTSQFRKAGKDGADLGPFAYEPNIFYVTASGNDQADGLSVGTAWKTFERAVKGLKAGDTLYLSAGTYQAVPDIALQGKPDQPISIRGRGKDEVILQGDWRADKSSHLAFQRLNFAGEVKVAEGAALEFSQCRFVGTKTGLAARNVQGLRIVQSEFVGFGETALSLQESSGVFLSGNLFDNTKGVAVRTDAGNSIQYSNYNSYARDEAAWETAGKNLTLAEVSVSHDQESAQRLPKFEVRDGLAVLQNRGVFSAGGPHGSPLGVFTRGPRSDENRVVVPLALHSVSATTANFEWVTSLPGMCEVAWGETPACENRATVASTGFGTFSLTGLRPGTTYYFRLLALRPTTPIIDFYLNRPLKTGGVELKGDPVSFATIKTNPKPQTYYVSTDGDNANNGLDRKAAWRTIQRAADQVNVGDTVLVAGGNYCETVRLRATGENDAPITFRAITGEKVYLNGGALTLSQGFFVAVKSHLRFDGFYFSEYSFFVNSPAWLHTPGSFVLYDCNDVQITRCLSDGRVPYRAPFATAWFSQNLLFKNSVFAGKMGAGITLSRCSDVSIENCVSARTLINAFVIDNTPEQKVTLKHNIITDMLKKKADLNIPLIPLESGQAITFEENCFVLRSFPWQKRNVFSVVVHALREEKEMTIAEYEQKFGDTKSIEADPLFAGALALIAKKGPAPENFPIEYLADAANPVDFDDFFATNPDLLKRGVGLQPEAFADFQFHKK